MIRCTTVMAALAALVMATPAAANPVSCEQSGGIAVADSGDTIAAWFYNCEFPDAYVVQWDNGGDWTTLDGSWAHDATQDYDGGKGQTYGYYHTEVGCPVKGSLRVRVASIYQGEAFELDENTVECTAVDETGATTDGGCNVANGPAASALALMGLIAMAFVRRRR